MLELNNFQKEQVFYGGIKWDLALSERLKDPIYLEMHGYKVYSQCDDDGIIQEIFNRIGTTDKRFIEFGAGDGLAGNTHYLLHKGWSGLWIECNTEGFNQINATCKSVIDNKRLKVVNAFITKDNINSIFEEAGFVGEIDFLSIDIDGNDYHVWEAINAINPRALIIEYSAKFPPDCEWIMPYKADYIYDGSEKQGASLKSYELLGIKKGYTLVGTNISGVNAFFVRSDLVGDLFPTPATAENLYNAPRYGWTWKSGHKERYCVADDAGHVNKSFQEIKAMKIVTDNIKSRKTLIWGTSGGFRFFKGALSSYNINDYICYDSKHKGYSDLPKEAILEDLSLITKEEHYVIISCIEFHGDIVAFLNQRGFRENIDYVYFSHC